jgi:hypothetical protein
LIHQKNSGAPASIKLNRLGLAIHPYTLTLGHKEENSEMFTRRYLEKGMWRGWFKNGQALEISWPRKWSHGWPGLAFQVLIHSNDSNRGNRMLNVSLGPVQAFIPFGVDQREFTVGDEPAWGFSLSSEFGLRLRWGFRSKTFQWAFRSEHLSTECLMPDGTWKDTNQEWDWRERAWFEKHPYTYIRKSGRVQLVEAEIRHERTVRGRRYLRFLGWPLERSESIDVRFSAEIGERAGSWKGGCVGCGYTMKRGENPLNCLRRMERERKFT